MLEQYNYREPFEGNGLQSTIPVHYLIALDSKEEDTEAPKIVERERLILKVVGDGKSKRSCVDSEQSDKN